MPSLERLIPHEDTPCSMVRALLAYLKGESGNPLFHVLPTHTALKKLVLGIISTISTILEPAFERGGRVKGVERHF